MTWLIVAALLIGCAILLLLERRGVRTTLSLSFRGDVKRETAFLAQYGQSSCTAITCLLIWQSDREQWRPATAVALAVIVASIAAMIVKRLTGRVRPNREEAGKFLGPALKHANYRESFPSSHSACAVAFGVTVSAIYPPIAPTVLGLAIDCAVLRWVLDAHWPSDVLAGIALGIVCAEGVVAALLES